jgi:hypothetical protein
MVSFVSQGFATSVCSEMMLNAQTVPRECLMNLLLTHHGQPFSSSSCVSVLTDKDVHSLMFED